jgi:hypothetical protein
MLEKDEAVILDKGLPGEAIVTIISFSKKMLVKVEDSQGQAQVVSLFRLSKP